MRVNVKSQTLEGYNFQNNGFRKKNQTVSKPALNNTSFKNFEIREGRGKVHFSLFYILDIKYIIIYNIYYMYIGTFDLKL